MNRIRFFLVNALLILPCAFLFALKNDMPHIFLITAAVLLIGLFRKNDLLQTAFH